MKKRLTFTVTILSFALASLFTGPVLAQDDEDKTSLEEVIVTATKRAESLQDIAMSVTVMDAQTLEQMGAIGFFDYATSVPNLSFGHIADGTFTSNGVQIRGIAGFGTTGFYIDDIPIPESMNPKVIDVARIEVLRGPQGSLYGARNMGGTIRMITKRADPTMTELKAHASAGSVSEGSWDYQGDAAFNVPISETAAFRGSVYYIRESGLYEVEKDNPNIVGDEFSLKNVDEGKYRGLQAMITWNATENFTVEPRFLYQKSNLDWLPFGDNSPDNFTNKRLNGIAEPNEEEWSISSLTLNWNTDWGNFTSATAFLNRETDEREDFSEFMNFFSGALGGDPGYVPPGGSQIIALNDRDQFTQEIRFASDFDSAFQLTAGAFYAKIEQDTHWPCSVAEGFSATTGIPFNTESTTGVADCVFTTLSHGEIEELAFFGELTWNINDSWSITAGGRYFDNTLDTDQESHGIVVEFGGPPAPRNIGTQSESGFNPKVAIEWQPNDDWTLYGTAAKGFRIGGTNNPVPVEFCAEDLAKLGITGSPDSFDSDSLWNYEIGSKSSHANGSLSLNVAAFLIDWTDIQQITRLECGFQFVNNTGIAESKGFEVEITGRPIENFTYTLGVGYTDAAITDPQDAANIFAGDPLPQVPEWTFMANAQYDFNIGANDGYLFVNYSWIDESVSVNQSITAPRVRPSYNILDARLGMYVGSWNISLFAKNLTDEHANLSDNRSLAAEDPRRPRIVTNRPRTIGIDVRWVY
jgi:outer membrane receptor protein involved in Fe transport